MVCRLWADFGSRGRLHATALRPSARVANPTPRQNERKGTSLAPGKGSGVGAEGVRAVDDGREQGEGRGVASPVLSITVFHKHNKTRGR